MLALLKRWQQNKQIRAIDFHFAKFMAQLGADNLTQLSAALISQQLGEGHICLPIDKIGDIFHQHCRYLSIDSKQESERLQISCIFHDPQQIHFQINESLCCGEGAPLRLQYGALFMARYAEYEQLIADKLLQPVNIQVSQQSKAQLDELFKPQYFYIWQDWQQNPAQAVQPLCEKYLDVLVTDQVDWPAVNTLFHNAQHASDLNELHRLIPDALRCDWQKISAALALTSPRCVISGGPGTGKTTTVVKLLALLLQAQPDLTIKLVAPTGKAAARLTESIGNTINGLHLPESIKHLIPSDASTIHRLLGVQANSAHFRFNEQHRLALDLLLVDEASMVDLPLMAKLLSALPDHARLILLGDKDQLASVEAGAVLGDICSFIESGYSQSKAEQLADLTGFTYLHNYTTAEPTSMADHLCLLRKSYRFDQFSGIGHLSAAVNSGQSSATQLSALCEQHDDLDFYPNQLAGETEFDRLVLEGYQPYLSELKPITIDNREHVRHLLALFNDFKVLCATRDNDWGLQPLNLRCQQVLQNAQLLSSLSGKQATWYAGRPIMITENSYHLNLFNGDIGLCLDCEDGSMRVYFVMADGSIADFQPSRLPAHETVFAMTVHKSQGSEFKHTLLALPQYASPVVNRELIYTGITRAKKRLTLIADMPLLVAAIKHRAIRYSRLVERLIEKREQFEPIKII